jgi:hypothetical protein
VTHTWADVPDPRDETCPKGRRCEILLEDHRWSHFHSHVSNLAEPWDDWLTPGLAADLRNSGQSTVKEANREATRPKVSDLMEQAAKQSVGVPLAVIYEVAQPPREGGRGSPWALTVDLVLCCGAKLCLREAKKVMTVCTCYFIAAARSAPKGRRWRLLLHQLLMRYAKDNGDGTFSPPDRSRWLVYIEETKESITNPRFRTDATWGADGKLVDPWDNLPDHFAPASPPTRPPSPIPSSTLEPRKPY